MAVICLSDAVDYGPIRARSQRVRSNEIASSLFLLLLGLRDASDERITVALER
jgi:hypothetical protein